MIGCSQCRSGYPGHIYRPERCGFEPCDVCNYLVLQYWLLRYGAALGHSIVHPTEKDFDGGPRLTGKQT